VTFTYLKILFFNKQITAGLWYYATDNEFMPALRVAGYSAVVMMIGMSGN